MNKHILPSLENRSFTCPRCGVVCPQELYQLQNLNFNLIRKSLSATLRQNEEYINMLAQDALQVKKENGQSSKKKIKSWDLWITVCAECQKYAIWENRKMIFPITTDLPDPEADMPDNVKAVYIEAALVFKYSPRSASALLRLAIETLLPQLPEYTITKKKLVGMIGELVEQGIPKHIQQALDGIRLFGNQEIHTAEIVEEDSEERGYFLFSLLNRIVKELITDKIAINAFYSSFPSTKLEAIAQRDNK